MSINNSQRCGFPTELLAATADGTVSVGTLAYNPVLIIFDNQSTASVALSVNDSTGATVWHTFPPGEALVLDLRNQHGQAANFTMDKGTSFYATSGSAAGNFSISYIYAQELVT
jgi:hypothetical protein